MRLHILAFCLAPISAQTVDAQEVKPSTRLELKADPGVPSLPVAPEKEPGDSVIVNAEGTIVSSSRGQTFRWPLTDQMKPQVDVTYSSLNGRVQYKYQVTNGVGALKSIGALMIQIAPPSDIVAPSPWTFTRIIKPNEKPAIGLNRLVRNGDTNGLLSAGKTIGPITFTSDLGPGLVDMIFYPEIDLDFKSEAGLTDGQFFNGASPWVQQQLIQLDTPSRHILRSTVIGPSAPLATDSVAQIRSELSAAAAQRSDFTNLRGRLQAAALPSDRLQLGRWISDLQKDSGPRVQSAFLSAINWRLQQLK
jgi:hypothetical protein